MKRTSKVGKKTSSGNFLAHAKAAHKETTIFLRKESSKLTNWIQTATSQFDVNRDIVLWLCQELLPFELIEKEGFQAFNKNNIHLHLSPFDNSPGRCLHGFEVQSQRTIVSGTIMLDGWTDARHHRYPYVGVRICTVDAYCNFLLFPLCVKPVENHTSENLTVFVRELLEEFLPKDKNVLLFDTTDGAANMIELSQLLGHERVTCVAH